MVEFDMPAALLAGLVATLVMTAMMTMATRAGMTAMPPMPLVVGSMMSCDRRKATTMGAIAHYVVMGTVVFGLIYAALFTAFDNDDWWVGTVIGIVHGLAVGLLFMPMMPTMHPRMTHELATTSGPLRQPSVIEAHRQVEISAPGVLGKNWGDMTPVGLVIGHAVYGLVLALITAGSHE